MSGAEQSHVSLIQAHPISNNRQQLALTMDLKKQTPQQAGKELVHAVRQAAGAQGGDVMVTAAIDRLDTFVRISLEAIEELQQEVAKLREEVKRSKT